jgi:hypothetical protein
MSSSKNLKDLTLDKRAVFVQNQQRQIKSCKLPLKKKKKKKVVSVF